MSKPFFTVIIPTYNRAAFIGQAVDSVLAQTFSDWELIVVDDASTDETDEILAGYSDPRIRVVRNEVNRERSYTRNRGINMASGAYICFLDSDDYYLENHLAFLHNEITKEPNPSKCFWIAKRVILTTNGKFRNEDISETGLTQAEYILKHQPSTSTFCIPLEALLQEKFDVALRTSQDVELLGRLTRQLKCTIVDSHSVCYRKHDANSGNFVDNYVEVRRNIFDRFLQDPTLRSQIGKGFIRSHALQLDLREIEYYSERKESRKLAYHAVLFIARHPFSGHNWYMVKTLVRSLLK